MQSARNVARLLHELADHQVQPARRGRARYGRLLLQSMSAQALPAVSLVSANHLRYPRHSRLR
eukprot:15351344-Heterocapsa_arctica.AAC.1